MQHMYVIDVIDVQISMYKQLLIWQYIPIHIYFYPYYDRIDSLFLMNNGFRTCFLLSGEPKFPIDVASQSPAVVAPTTVAGSTTSSGFVLELNFLLIKLPMLVVKSRSRFKKNACSKCYVCCLKCLNPHFRGWSATFTLSTPLIAGDALVLVIQYYIITNFDGLNPHFNGWCQPGISKPWFIHSRG